MGALLRAAAATAAGLALLAGTAPAAAQAAYPARPIRLVIPFPPGGTTDTMARLVARQVELQLAQPIVVENKGGANGQIGFEQVAKAAPDGYTLLHTSPSLVINEFIYKDLRYQVRDFTPITNLALGTGYLILVHPQSPMRTLADLAAAARVRKEAVSYGSAGVGNTSHLMAALIGARQGTEMLHVPYKGLVEAMNGVMAGDVQVAVTPPTVALTFVKAGKLRALAFTGAARWDQLPDVPTMSESGYPGFELPGGWLAWFGPAGTPPAIVNRLQAEIAKALKVPEVRDFIEKGGYNTDGRSPAEFRSFVDAEVRRYGEAVKAARIEPQ